MNDVQKEKDVRIPLYVSPVLKNDIAAKAKSLGLTTNAYIRLLVIKDLQNSKN